MTFNIVNFDEILVQNITAQSTSPDLTQIPAFLISDPRLLQ